ncbi:MAG: adenosylcobalamin-dependent ribonucleoside-diphosphate reductase [Planctomycetota bacterium]
MTRRFTKPGQDVFESVEWEKRRSRITDTDGKVVFEMRDAEVPKQWSQLATDIMVSRYFRRGEIPQCNDDGSPKLDERGEQVTGPERSVRQVVNRLAGCWRYWGEKHGYFNSRIDAEAFFDELSYMLLHQIAAPNSPQWFNTGVNWAYDISGPPQGHWFNTGVNWAYDISGPPQGHFVPDPETGEARLAPDAFTHSQAHACFIQPIRDDLVNHGGIMDLWTREARLFKYGSGTGTNFSTLRGENEPLSGGGKSSGLMSFLRIGDRAAGAIKSGGTTRRAAKMVCLDADHPDIEAFVDWKVREELKVAAMVEGMKHLSPDKQELARSLGLELNYDFNGEAYYTVSGQNSNNSVRLTDAFFEALDADGDWHLRRRTDGQIAKTIKARDLWEKITFAAWRCADPGIQFDTTTNAWHTCPANGRINASNPCNEYLFLDNTACNLASINLMKFYDAESKVFDIDGFEHAIRLWTIVLEITVLMAAYPSQEIAEQSWRFRTLGLGYANVGAMLMQASIPYDSDEGRAVCGVVSAILTGRAYATSAEMARQLGAFAGFDENREAMLRVIRNHRRAAVGVPRDSDEYEELSVRPVPIDHELFNDGRLNLANAEDMMVRATLAWDEALLVGEKSGFRNAQTTALAPTGTIGLLMDCDTTGVEPDFALTKFKKLAGGGYFKIANQSLRPSLKTLGYDEKQVDEIVGYVMGTLSLDAPMPEEGPEGVGTFRDFLVRHGYTSEDVVELENQLPTVFELDLAFTAWSMPKHVLESLSIDVEAAQNEGSFNGLRALGLDDRQIEVLNRTICGTQTVEGAPHLSEEHLPVFDCANTCGKIGKRFIATDGHIRMMAAAQPFISGAISKTVNLPHEATVADIADAYRLSWELGLKANAQYRDGSKLSQPLSTRSDGDAAVAADEIESVLDEDLGQVVTAAVEAEPPAPAHIVERIIDRPLRRRLPDTRSSVTHRFNVSGHEGYLTVGLYENGSPGELFITMAKEGSTIGGLMDCLGTAISVALQYGVPIESLVKKFAHQRFEPMGMTTNSNIPFAKSLVDDRREPGRSQQGVNAKGWPPHRLRLVRVGDREPDPEQRRPRARLRARPRRGQRPLDGDSCRRGQEAPHADRPRRQPARRNRARQNGHGHHRAGSLPRRADGRCAGV